jgi:hypothetical protein
MRARLFRTTSKVQTWGTTHRIITVSTAGADRATRASSQPTMFPASQTLAMKSEKTTAP